MLLSPFSPILTPSPPPSRFTTRIPLRSQQHEVPLKRTRLSLPDDCSEKKESFYEREFIIDRILGKGDFGVVTSVVHIKSGEKSAIKKYFLSTLKSKNGKKYSTQQMREVKLHKSLPSHPNIVHFQRAWKDNGELFLQMELCANSLEGIWKEREQLSEREMHTAMMDVMMGLDHLHCLGFLHLDIKPGNIMVTDDMRCKIGDFSVAMDFTKDNPMDADFGDKMYAAPELFTHIFTPKADLFSLGITLSEISVPSSSPLNEDEWESIRKRGSLPDRVSNVLKGELNMDMTFLSLINQDSFFRPDLITLIEKGLESRQSGITLFALRAENSALRDGKSSEANRYSFSNIRMRNPSRENDKEMNEISLIFDDDERFDEKTKSKFRHSMDFHAKNLFDNKN